jgi:hypothetical protein
MEPELAPVAVRAAIPVSRPGPADVVNRFDGLDNAGIASECC